MCKIINHSKDTRYPIDQSVANMCEVPYQRISNIINAYDDIRGTYDALFDALGTLGHWRPLMEKVEYLGMSLEVVEEYFGCLPEDVKDLKFFDIDEAHERFALWNNRRRLLTFVPVYLLDRVSYLGKIGTASSPDHNNLNYLFEECRKYLVQIEELVSDVAAGENAKVEHNTSMHMGIYPNEVVFDSYSFKESGEMVDMSVRIPLYIYDMLRNNNLIGFHIAFLNYKFDIEAIRDLYEAMENIIIMTVKEEE